MVKTDKQRAKELQQAFPEETLGFTVEEIDIIWGDYSYDSCAGWLYPNQKGVEIVFKTLYMKDNSGKLWKSVS